MLRINLLPAYIAERRKTRTAIVLSTVAFALVCAGLLFFYVTLSAQVAAKEQEATDEEQKQAAVEAIKSKTTQIRAQIAPLQDKVNFVENVRFHNTLAPTIYRNAAKYTIRQVEYNSMKITGNSLTIGGFVSGEGGRNEPSGRQAVQNFGRYLITFFGNPDITALSVQGLPGYPSPATGTGTGTGANTGGFPGGFPGGPPGGFSGGPGGPPGGFPGGPGGDFPGAPGQSAALGQLPSRPGFPFTATATLKRPVTAPTVPASAGGGTAVGGVPGGFPGDFPGGPPPGFDPAGAGAPPPDLPPAP
jgi:cell division protein FtsB